MPNYDDVDFYYGTHTGMEIDNAVDVMTAWSKSGVLYIAISSISSLPCTITDDRITANHDVIMFWLSNPKIQTGRWTVTTAAGSLTISGNTMTPQSGTTLSTNARIILAKRSAFINTTA